MNHTPGPWRYSPAHKDIISMANVGRDDLICDVRGSEHGSVIPSEANAQLIAAAPELVAALKRLSDEYENQQGQFGSDYIWKKYEDAGAIEEARRVLDKIRGASE